MKRIGKYLVRNMGKTAVKWILFLAVAAVLRNAVQAADHYQTVRGISDQVLRFHVIANSDSAEDQRVKYQIRDRILDWLEQEEKRSGEVGETGENKEVKEMTSREETENYYHDRLWIIEEKANQILKENEMPYCAKAVLEDRYISSRTYGTMTFPAGWYRTVTIKLGEAQGRNWWCLLYPELAFENCLHLTDEIENEGIAVQQEELKDILTVSEYEELLAQPKKWKISFRWF